MPRTNVHAHARVHARVRGRVATVAVNATRVTVHRDRHRNARRVVAVVASPRRRVAYSAREVPSGPARAVDIVDARPTRRSRVLYTRHRARFAEITLGGA